MPCRGLRSLDYLVYPIEGEELTLLFSARPYVKERDLIVDSFIIQQGKRNKLSGGWELKQNRLEIRSFCKEGVNWRNKFPGDGRKWWTAIRKP